MSDKTTDLQNAVQEALANQCPVHLAGGKSKAFLGNTCSADELNVSAHSGVISYEPTELVITARCGTPLSELKETLAENNQQLPFEPPAFGVTATLGGTLACALSGPARPYAGAARDMVLGTRVINGKGEVLRFGGEVMKNVAGYDLSRLMVGSHGTLGIILEASMKVLPAPAATLTLAFEMTQSEAIDQLNRWAGKSFPISASLWMDGTLQIRLSGAESAVDKSRTELGGDAQGPSTIWRDVAEHALPFFRPLASGESLWRLSLPQSAPPLNELGEDTLVEWGGAQRWIISDESAENVRSQATAAGGHATRFRHTQAAIQDVFQGPAPGLSGIHGRIKAAMDPEGLFNPGVFYADF